MPDVIKLYPEIEEYLDDTDDYQNSATEFKQGEDRFLLVTQEGIDGQQLLFKWSGENFEFWENETILDAAPASPAGDLRPFAADATIAQCGPSAADEHKRVHEHVMSQVNKFSSREGPSRGILACVWVVRHLVRRVLNRWITLTDGTAVFEPELRRCFGRAYNADDILPGGIVISPTKNIPGSKRRNVGHIGFLSTGNGGKRLIYSNSSSRARLEQNFTVSSWIARYHDTKKLSVMYYPLPLKSMPRTS